MRSYFLRTLCPTFFSDHNFELNYCSDQEIHKSIIYLLFLFFFLLIFLWFSKKKNVGCYGFSGMHYIHPRYRTTPMFYSMVVIWRGKSLCILKIFEKFDHVLSIIKCFNKHVNNIIAVISPLLTMQFID